jgi:hypothetical protein
MLGSGDGSENDPSLKAIKSFEIMRNASCCAYGISQRWTRDLGSWDVQANRSRQGSVAVPRTCSAGKQMLTCRQIGPRGWLARQPIGRPGDRGGFRRQGATAYSLNGRWQFACSRALMAEPLVENPG